MLKKCPFCGHDPKMVEWENGCDIMFYVECQYPFCPVTLATRLFKTPTQAKIAWNTRKGENNEKVYH